MLVHALSVPTILFRDPCECVQCYVEKTREHKYQLEDIRLDKTPDWIPESDCSLHTVWSDGHDPVFSNHRLICLNAFNSKTVKHMPWPTKTDQYNGALYLSIEANDSAVWRVKSPPFEHSTRLAVIYLMQHPRLSDDGRVTVFNSSEFELVSEHIEA